MARELSTETGNVQSGDEREDREWPAILSSQGTVRIREPLTARVGAWKFVLSVSRSSALHTLHEPAVVASLRSRLEALRVDMTPRWGKMTVDQMLWHVNKALEECVGRFAPTPRRRPIPKALLKLAVLNLPWPKGAPTNPNFVAKARHDFDGERARCLQLIEEISKRDIDSSWPSNEDFGRMSGKDWSRLHAKHLDHHLTQFGV